MKTNTAVALAAVAAFVGLAAYLFRDRLFGTKATALGSTGDPSGLAAKLSNALAPNTAPANVASMITLPAPASQNTVAQLLNAGPNIAKSISDFANIFKGKIWNTTAQGVKGSVSTPAVSDIAWQTDPSYWV